MSSSQMVHAAKTDVMAVVGIRPTRVSQPYDEFHRSATGKLPAQFPALLKNLRRGFAFGKRTVCNLVQSEGSSDTLNSLDGDSLLPSHAGKGGKGLPIHLAAAGHEASVEEVLQRPRHVAEIGWRAKGNSVAGHKVEIGLMLCIYPGVIIQKRMV